MWFKILLISSLICVSISYSNGKSHKCKELEECVKGENDISCLKRYKRHCTGSSNSCSDCDCDYCSTNTCSSTCNTCCANFNQQCSSTYCCYKTCHSQCASQSCRKSCRNVCNKKIPHTKPGGSDSSQSQQSNAVNITTVINLHNKINNTNQIDIPVNVNSTNYNNFTIDAANEYDGYYGGGQTSGQIVLPQPPHPQQPQPQPPHPQPHPQQQSCCQVVGPRQCTPQAQYPYTRCYHLRRKQCGSFCASSIMHAQQHQVCEQASTGQQSCHNQLIYIPQPQTRCAYQQAWPYVTCGIPQPNCEGCYGTSNEEVNQECPPSCFQDAFAGGRYFSPGPVGATPLIAPNFENSYSVRSIDPNEIVSSDPQPKRGKEEGSLPINIIQDGININDIPSSFIPPHIPINQYGSYPSFPPVPYPPYSPPYPAPYPAPYSAPYPFWPPQPPFSGLPIPELPLFANNNIHNKRGANENTEKNEAEDDVSAEEEEDNKID
ncbi:uncharacterized protein [Onthophagus taurus]|uniref:uncharacterized protein n=1 Tax=Onthophagus taurus TaxID=166361 RepID=UPI0039BDD75F